MVKSLPILIVIGLFVLPSGRALRCYQCSSDLEGDCANPKQDKLNECPQTTTPPATTKPITTTTAKPITTTTAKPITTTTDESSTTTTDESSTTTTDESSTSTTDQSSTSTTDQSSTSTTDESSTSTSSIPDGSGGGAYEGEEDEIIYGGKGVEVVSGDEGDEHEGTNDGSAKTEKKKRVSRAIVHHFSSKQVYADGDPKMVCVKKTTNTTVTRGCAPTSKDCSGGNCHECDTDACNSATSVAVYMSMMFGLLTFVFMTR